MKKIRLIAALLLIAMLVSACGSNTQAPAADKAKSSAAKVQVPEGFTAFTYEAGKYFTEETTWLRLPSAYKNEAAKKGTIERVDYTTDVYGDSVTYEKHVNVYLPYGYKPEDKDTKYNVVYFQHGDGQYNDTVFLQEQYNMLDNMIANNDIDPVIIVFTTFYMYEDNKEVAGDGRNGTLPNLFYKEVTESILPVVETKYNTYLTGTTKEDFVNTRDHRAFTGYSRGSVATWNMFHNAFEYFRFYAPMSAGCLPEQGNPEQGGVWQSDGEMVNYIVEPIDAHPDMKYFIYTCKGTAENPEKQAKIVEDLVASGKFSYGYDREENSIAITISNLSHSDRYVPYYYYHSLNTFFK